MKKNDSLDAQIIPDIHADDFGESVHASADILDCLKEGKLDSISILGNMSCFAECVSMYREAEGSFPKEPLLSVHINIMEGKALADAREIPDLTDEQGHFCSSWEKLFLQSFLPGKDKLKQELKKEIRLQIEKVKAAFPEMKKLRIDSHQHTHMIPVVAAALFEVLEEKKWEVEYIRDAREPFWVFAKKASLYKTYQPVNFIKNTILNFCSLLLQKRFRSKNLPPMLLWGLIMSGHMDLKRVELLLPDMKKKAAKTGRTLEILFHPGQVLQEEITEEFSQKEAIAFHVSEGRTIEKYAVMHLGGEK